MPSRVDSHDDGYISPSGNSDSSPSKPVGCEYDDRATERLIARDTKRFKNEYFIEKVILNSANGIIYQGLRKRDGLEICAKQVPKAKIGNWEDHEGRKIPREFKLHLMASEIDGVVKVIEFFERKTSFVLIMEKPSNSIDIYEFSQLYGRIDEAPARVVFRKVTEICYRLENAGIFHRDIKDENILLNIGTLEPKLIDFGCAVLVNNAKDQFTSFSGTPEFAAPEVRSLCHLEKLDYEIVDGGYEAGPTTVWTLGILLYVLVFGDTPFDTSEHARLGIRNKYDETAISKELRSLLDQMLHRYPDQRCSIAEILHQSAWLSQDM